MEIFVQPAGQASKNCKYHFVLKRCAFVSHRGGRTASFYARTRIGDSSNGRVPSGTTSRLVVPRESADSISGIKTLFQRKERSTMKFSSRTLAVLAATLIAASAQTCELACPDKETCYTDSTKAMDCLLSIPLNEVNIVGLLVLFGDLLVD